MKKLIYAFILFPIFSFGQDVSDWDPSLYNNGNYGLSYPIVTDNNMPVIFEPGSFLDYVGGELLAFKDGVPVSAPQTIVDDGACGVAVIGKDALCGDCEHLPVSGDELNFAILMNGEYIVIIDVDPPVTYGANYFQLFNNGNLSFTPMDPFYPINGPCEYMGCLYQIGDQVCMGGSICSFDENCQVSSPCLTVMCDVDICYIYGCTNSSAINYNPNATSNDNSCIYPVSGCMDALALNYNPDANIEDGSCIEIIEGCINPSAINYNPNATSNDNSCIYPVSGCMDALALNYNPDANIEDGSCIEIIQGCTNPAANNYNPNATSNDNSCIYPMLNPWGGWTNETNQESPSYVTTDYLSVLFPVQNGDIWDTDSDIDVGDVIFAVYETSRLENLLVGYSHFTGVESAGAASWTGNQIEMNIWGSDYGENNGYMNSELIKWLVLKADGEIYNATVNYITPLFNGNYESGISITVNSVNIGNNFLEGCMDPNSIEFNPIASYDDGSCTTFYSIGCLDISAINYAGLNSNPSNELANNFWDPYGENLTLDLYTGQQYPSGIAANTADNSMCQYIGCTSDWADNYDELSSIDDSSCFKLGCFDNLAINFDEFVTDNDGSCEYDIITQLNQSFDAWNISIDLSAGWNMFGYGCPSSIDVAEGLSNHTESIIITKDNSGNVFMPEFGFNGIGDFTPGFGYQIKLTVAIEGFSLCDWYVNDIPEDNIVSLQEEVINLSEVNSSLQAFVDSINVTGCMDTLACNFDITNLYDGGSCEYASQFYDCDGNINFQIGDEAFGGIVFYIDSINEYGLVAAMDNLEGTYAWGCSNIDVNGADGTTIGTGHQNTIDIVSHGCSITKYSNASEEITAAKATLDAEINGFNDWYLPSKDELAEMYNTIGNGGPEGNIGGFEDDDYWSSSEYSNEHPWYVFFTNGSNWMQGKNTGLLVRPIRTF